MLGRAAVGTELWKYWENCDWEILDFPGSTFTAAIFLALTMAILPSASAGGGDFKSSVHNMCFRYFPASMVSKMKSLVSALGNVMLFK